MLDVAAVLWMQHTGCVVDSVFYGLVTVRALVLLLLLLRWCRLLLV